MARRHVFAARNDRALNRPCPDSLDGVFTAGSQEADYAPIGRDHMRGDGGAGPGDGDRLPEVPELAVLENTPIIP